MAFSDDLSAATAELDAAHQALADANTAKVGADAAQAIAQQRRDAAVAALKAVAEQA